MIALDSIVFDKTYGSVGQYTAIVDTGTSALVGPAEVFDPILNTFPDHVDCAKLDQYPVLKFVINAIEYTLQPSDYILAFTEDGQTQCEVGLIPDRSGSNMFILGDSFIKVYYTLFEVDKKRVQFAKAV